MSKGKIVKGIIQAGVRAIKKANISPKSGVESALEKAKVVPTNLGRITKSKAIAATRGVESAFEKSKVAPRSLGTITKSKAAEATKRVESAGAVKKIAKTKATDIAVLGGTAAAVGAGIAYNMSNAKKDNSYFKKATLPAAMKGADTARKKIEAQAPSGQGSPLTNSKPLVAKSKHRAQSFKPENKLGRAKLTGGMGNKETGYKKSSSTSRTGMKETRGRFKK